MEWVATGNTLPKDVTFTVFNKKISKRTGIIVDVLTNGNKNHNIHRQ